MIFSVYVLEEELKIVRLYAASRLDGIRFGKSPITPVNTTITMVTQDEANAINGLPFARKILIPSRAATARSGTIRSIGALR